MQDSSASTPAPTSDGSSAPASSASPATDSPLSSVAAPRRRPAWLHWPLVLSGAAWQVVWIAYFVLAASLLLVRYVVAPRVADERPRIEQALSEQLGMKVQIAALEANWNGLRPELRLEGLQIYDRQGRPALILPRVDAAVAWSSLLHWRLELNRLEIVQPELSVRRESNGHFYIAGLDISTGGDPDSDNGFANFALSQHQILIRDARIEWNDQMREASPLVLNKVALRLENDGDRHRFALRASPPAEHSSDLDVRGDLRGAGVRSVDDWRGTLFVSLDRADLAVWKRWVDYPLSLPQGRGGVRAWLNFEGRKVAGLTTDVALADVALRITPELPMLELAALSGRIRASARGSDYSVSGERLTLVSRDGLTVEPTRFAFRHRGASADQPAHGEFSTERLDVRVIAQLAGYLPLPQNWRQRIVQTDPQGRVDKLAVTWEGDSDIPQKYTLDTKFEALKMQPVGLVPGFSGLSGEVRGNEREGAFAFQVHEGLLDAPALMHEPQIPIDKADVAGVWSHERSDASSEPLLTVKLGRAQLVNTDVSADFSGSWQARPEGPGHLDLTGAAHRAQVSSVWRYIPTSAPSSVQEWLKQGLLGGHGENARLRVSGDLHRFPFLDHSGIFRVEVEVFDGLLNYGNGWPGMSGVHANVLFEGTRMLIRSDRGLYQGAKTRDVKVEIPDLLAAGKQVLTVDGKASGTTMDFLHYVNHSRIADHAGDFTRGVQAQGGGELSLHIEVPLHSASDSRVRGDYKFSGNTLHLLSSLPEFSDARGVLAFTEHGISLPGAEASFIGGRVKATGVTEPDGTLRFDGQGFVPVTGLRQLVTNPSWSRLSGDASAKVEIKVRKQHASVKVDSNLLGVTAHLPAPMFKDQSEAWPTTFSWQLDANDPDDWTAGSTQNWSLAIDKRLALQWQDRCRENRCSFARGALASGDDAILPQRGWRLAGQFDRLDVDPWRPVVEEFLSGIKAGEGEALAGASVRVGELVAGGHRFDKVNAKALRQGSEWNVQVDGPDLAGNIVWDSEGRGRLQARLQRLRLDPVPAGFEPVAEPDGVSAQKNLPTLSIVAEQFKLRNIDLGRLELEAVNQENAWRLRNISLKAPDLALSGDGVWRRAGTDAGTHLQFKLDSEDAGALLARLGYANTVRRGVVAASGAVSWRGMPTSMHYPTLSGTMNLKVRDGQFAKMEPGAGRLLGVLSLQSLPRRLTLDFRDVFSEGFAFDTISGSMTMKSGVLRTDDLEVRGPAAKVFMTGTTDLAREEHNLHVRVQPTLSETVAVGVAVGQAAVGVLNPVVGAATYLAQKLLRDPVEKIFSYEYSIAGPWSDPKIEKTGSSVVTAAQSAPAK